MKYVISIIAFCLIIWFVIAVVRFKQSDNYASLQTNKGSLFEYVKQFIEIQKHNMSFIFTPVRKRPVTVIDRQEKLMMFLPQVFEKFEDTQWEEFWSLVYDPIDEGKGLLKVKRFRTQEEMEQYLFYNYSEGFSLFQREHWDYFWRVVFGKDSQQIGRWSLSESEAEVEPGLE